MKKPARGVMLLAGSQFNGGLVPYATTTVMD